MKAMFPLFMYLVTLYSSFLGADVPKFEPPANKVVFELKDDFIFITYTDHSDLLIRRPIEVFNERGKRIFRCQTKKMEKITELNMQQLKEGRYYVRTIVDDVVYKQTFTR